MTRPIIDIPRVLMRAVSCDWDVQWGGQSAGGDTGGGDQTVINRFPRFVGAPSVVLPPEMVGLFRALRAQAEGRVGAWRVPMVDPVSAQMPGNWRSDLAALQAGTYVEPRPKVICVGAVAAGASSLVVNEVAAPFPVRVGAFLSYADWPMIVTGRSGSGAAVTLTIKMLRVAIPAGAEIDLCARGLFVAAD